MTGSHATDWSVAFLGQLIAQGLRHCVVSPGARSQALALAALEWERVPESGLTVQVVVDERSAAFVAVGLGIETAQAALCISTSGSAPAHYYPAVLEALHQGVPLICVTADRPEKLRGVGANQTTDQHGMFGPHVSAFHVEATTAEAVGLANATALEVWEGALSGAPVHLNVGFMEPLSATLQLGGLKIPAALDLTKRAPIPVSLSVSPQAGTLVVAGHGAGAQAETLAHELGAPLIAEVVSGARFGPHLVLSSHQVLTDNELTGTVTRVITCGRPTLSRAVTALLSRTDVEHIVVRGNEWQSSNLSRTAKIVDALTVTRLAEKEETALWVKPWVLAGREHHAVALASFTPEAPDLQALVSDDPATRSAFARTEMNVVRRPITREALALEVWEASWPHDRLVFGASRMVRVADQIVGGKNITVHSNRGLSGIDGTIATARGIACGALESGAGGTTRVLLGDLATLHDVGSLWVEHQSTESPRLHLVVANDGGGTIFDDLEVRSTAPEEDFDRVLYTPHTVDMSALATAYGWQYRKVATMGELTEALSLPDARLMIDVTLQR